MPEYIDKSVILDQISKQKLFYEEKRKQSGDCLEEMNCVGAENGLTALEDIISDIPAADVAPVVHGRWTTPRAIIECSKCGFGMFPDGYFFEFGECVHAYESQYRPNFCPNCGAKLDLEND